MFFQFRVNLDLWKASNLVFVLVVQVSWHNSRKVGATARKWHTLSHIANSRKVGAAAESRPSTAAKGSKWTNVYNMLNIYRESSNSVPRWTPRGLVLTFLVKKTYNLSKGHDPPWPRSGLFVTFLVKERTVSVKDLSVCRDNTLSC